jgi:hypothetical protein
MEGWGSERTATSMGNKYKGSSSLNRMHPAKEKKKKFKHGNKRGHNVPWDPAWNIA